MWQEENNKKSLVKIGILSAVIASACCWLPLILIFLGIISIGTALRISYYTVYFFVAGFVLTAFSVFLYWKNGLKTCCITKKTYKKHILVSFFILFSVVLASYFIKNIIVPYLAPIVYEQSFNE